MKALTRRIVRMDADPDMWLLFDRYLAIMNSKLKKRGWPKVNQARLMGAIISYFLLANEKRILSDYPEVELEELREKLGPYFSDAELAAIGLREVPHVPGTGGAERNPPVSTEAERALRELAGE